jgi:hypothetical protein
VFSQDDYYFPETVRVLDHFTVEVAPRQPFAGESYNVKITAKDKDDLTIEGYEGEGFNIYGGGKAPNGSKPQYIPLTGWLKGQREYEVTQYLAGVPFRILAQDGKIRSRSPIIMLNPGEPDKLVISAGNGQVARAGSDVTLVAPQDLEVVVFDQWSNPIDGVAVEFGNATNKSKFDTDSYAEGIQRTSISKNGGRAHCEVWILGSVPGSNMIDATMESGSIRSVTFEATGTLKGYIGLLFNINDILLNIESYQGGIGLKYFIGEKLAYRGLFDFSYTNQSNAFSISIGNGLLYHFITGRLSPYAGAELKIGYNRLEIVDETGGTIRTTNVPLSFAGIFGFEIFIFDFLSVFAEYQLALNILNVKTVTNGVTTKDSFVDLGTDIGNESKIGLVFYFNTFHKH